MSKAWGKSKSRVFQLRVGKNVYRLMYFTKSQHTFINRLQNWFYMRSKLQDLQENHFSSLLLKRTRVKYNSKARENWKKGGIERKEKTE